MPIIKILVINPIRVVKRYFFIFIVSIRPKAHKLNMNTPASISLIFCDTGTKIKSSPSTPETRIKTAKILFIKFINYYNN